jgi:MFS family permease
MRNIVLSISSLLFGNTFFLLAIGLLGILLGIRAGIEGFPASITGAIMSSYFFGYAVGTFTCPRIIKRVGHIRAFATFAAIASITAILYAIFVNPYIWIFLRIITGMSIVGLSIVIESWLNVLAPNQQRGKLFSIYLMATFMALAFGQYLVLLADVTGFTLFGIISILLSLSLVPVALTRVKEPIPAHAPSVHVLELYQISPFGVFGTFSAGLLVAAFWGMGPLFAHQIGLEPAQVATYMFITILGGAVLQWPVGHFSDSHDRRTVLVFVCLLAAILSVGIALMATESYLILLVLSFLYGGMSFSLYGISIAHVNDHTEPAEMLETSKGLLFVYGVGATLGPLLAGMMMTKTSPANLYLFSTVILAAVVIFGIYRYLMRKPVPVEDQTEFTPMIRTSQVAFELDPTLDAETNQDKHLDN